MFKLKRAYETTNEDDGFRVLVDRLWPRGVKKDDAEIDLWLKDIAPSVKLRKWFNHEAKKWSEFRHKYRAELRKNQELLEQLAYLGQKHGEVTLVYAARDIEHNAAAVLKEVLEGMNFYDQEI